ncbi:hypothetical protein ABTO93_19895, partial [Acinetobacter baumannii]
NHTDKSHAAFSFRSRVAGNIHQRGEFRSSLSIQRQPNDLAGLDLQCKCITSEGVMMQGVSYGQNG